MGFLLLIGFAAQTACLWLQVTGDMRKVWVIMGGIEAPLTAIPAEELRARHQDQNDAEVAVGHEQTH